MAVTAQVELNAFESRSADAFSFDDGIEFVRKGEVLEIVERDPGAREAWGRDGRKLGRLHNYWFYWAMDELIHCGLAEQAIGLPENHEANRLAYIKAIRTLLRLTEVYGLDETVATETGQRVELFQALLASELMNAFYQQDFLQAFVGHAARLGHWAAALSQLALEGMANGSQNRFPLTWSDRMQNNSTAAINNLRRLGARRGEARLETRRIEERLGALFESRGFHVVLNWIPDDDQLAGEVDLICALDRSLLVLELKSTFIRQSQRDAWLHRTTTLRKAGRQVRDKVVAVRRALARDEDLAQRLGLQGTCDGLNMYGWIVDTSIECDHQRFSGFLKVSMEEVLIALRDDRHLLNDQAGICSGRFLEPDIVTPDDPQRQATLYPNGFSVEALCTRDRKRGSLGRCAVALIATVAVIGLAMSGLPA